MRFSPAQDDAFTAILNSERPNMRPRWWQLWRWLNYRADIGFVNACIRHGLPVLAVERCIKMGADEDKLSAAFMLIYGITPAEYEEAQNPF